MRANEFLAAKVDPEQETVVVSGLWDTHIRILGSNLPLSAVPGGPAVNSFSFSMEEGQGRGLIAVHVSRFDGSRISAGEFFLPVYRRQNGAPFVELEEPWMPRKGRLGQVHYEGVEVAIRGKTFASVDVSGRNAHKAEGFARDYYVRDPNVICQYLAGDVGADAVIHAATQYKVEANAKARLPEFERKLAAAKDKIAELQQELTEAEDKIDATDEYLSIYRRAHASLHKKNDAMSSELDDLKRATRGLLFECKKRRFKSRDLVGAIMIAENRL